MSAHHVAYRRAHLLSSSSALISEALLLLLLCLRNLTEENDGESVDRTKNVFASMEYPRRRDDHKRRNMRGEVLLTVLVSLVLTTKHICSSNSLSVKTWIFYYTWYGNPWIDGQWIHWSQNDHCPEEDLSSNYYPSLSAYSSADPIVLFQHMLWLQSANVGRIISSWWGIDSHDDRLTRHVLDAAHHYGIQVAFHLEPYAKRTATSIARDIVYICSTYGDHPAFLKVIRPTKWGNSSLARPVFFVFESLQIDDHSWSQLLDSIRSTPFDAIVLGQTTDLSRIDTCHFDGLYNYDTLKSNSSLFRPISDGAKAKNSIFSASVSPGYVDTRAVANSRQERSRADGHTYDSMWHDALDAHVEWISINSFNEWHEGSQIEPATSKAIEHFRYEDYQGAYGKRDYQAENAYLHRTRHWINKFEKGLSSSSQ